MRIASRSFAWVVAATVLTACGGENVPDHASSFTGTWIGTGSMGAGASFEDVPRGPGAFPPLGIAVNAQLTSDGANALRLDNICPGTDLVPATVTSESSFDIREFSCAPVAGFADEVCSSPWVAHVDGGSGTLVNDTIVIAATGTWVWCGTTYPFTYTFSGYRG